MSEGRPQRLAFSHTRAIDRLAEVVDPALLRRSARWLVPLAPLRPSLPQSWRPVKTDLADPARWYAGYLGVRGEQEIPWELQKDLRERVPQALLRDLFRPVQMERPVRWEPFRSGADPGGREGLREAREALVRPPPPEIEMGAQVVAREQARRRRFLRQPWQPMHQDDAPRQYNAVPWSTEGF